MAENNLQQFRQLPTLKKIDLLVDLHREEGYQVVEQLLNDLHIKELEVFALDFENFVGTSGSRNRFRSIIRKVLHQRLDNKDTGLSNQNKLSTFLTRLVPLLLDEEAFDNRIEEEKRYLNEVIPEGYTLVDIVEKEYNTTLKTLKRNYGPVLGHYIITLENESGIHSFCWNKNSRTLIYGFNAEDLMYIKLGKENVTEIAELIQELLEG